MANSDKKNINESIQLTWLDSAIPHLLTVEKTTPLTSRLSMKVVKDVEPEILYLNLPVSQETVIKSWKGCAFSVSEEFNDGTLYSQVRVLLNLSEGCVAWTVNHIQLPDGQKMSADKLVLIPKMMSENGSIIANF